MRCHPRTKQQCNSSERLNEQLNAKQGTQRKTTSGRNYSLAIFPPWCFTFWLIALFAIVLNDGNGNYSFLHETLQVGTAWRSLCLNGARCHNVWTEFIVSRIIWWCTSGFKYHSFPVCSQCHRYWFRCDLFRCYGTLLSEFECIRLWHSWLVTKPHAIRLLCQLKMMKRFLIQIQINNSYRVKDLCDSGSQWHEKCVHRLTAMCRQKSIRISHTSNIRNEKTFVRNNAGFHFHTIGELGEWKLKTK